MSISLEIERCSMGEEIKTCRFKEFDGDSFREIARLLVEFLCSLKTNEN